MNTPRNNKKNHRRNRAVLYTAQGATVAALYVALTMLCAAAGLASMAVQVRISEALCVLPYFMPAAVPGLFIGCLLANLLSGAMLWDIVFGSLATLVGALGALLLSRLSRRADTLGHIRRERFCRVLIPFPTVAANTVVVPLVLKYAYALPDGLPFLFATVGAGEVISAWGLGLCLLATLRRTRIKIK